MLCPAAVSLQHLNQSYAFGTPFAVINQANPIYNGISESGRKDKSRLPRLHILSSLPPAPPH